MQPGVLLNREGPEASLARLRDRVDLSRLDLRTETDLSDIFHLLVSAVAGTLVAAGASSDPAGARARLMRVFGILRRGARPPRRSAAKKHSKEKEKPLWKQPKLSQKRRSPLRRGLGKKSPQLTPPKKKRKWVKRLVILLVIAALLVLALSRCMSAGTQALSSAYLPYTAAMHDMTVAVSGTSTIEPIQSLQGDHAGQRRDSGGPL